MKEYEPLLKPGNKFHWGVDYEVVGVKDGLYAIKNVKHEEENFVINCRKADEIYLDEKLMKR